MRRFRVAEGQEVSLPGGKIAESGEELTVSDADWDVIVKNNPQASYEDLGVVVPQQYDENGNLIAGSNLVLQPVVGPQGLSAFQVAQESGYTGTQAQWLATLKGEKGDRGDKGDKGETGATGAPSTVPGPRGEVGPAGSATEWVPEIILDGVQAVANNVLPPGLRCPKATSLRAVILRAGTAPAGAALSVRVNANGTALGTWTLPAGQTVSTTNLGTPAAITSGAIVTFDVTAVGSTTAGADIAVQLVCS